MTGAVPGPVGFPVAEGISLPSAATHRPVRRALPDPWDLSVTKMHYKNASQQVVATVIPLLPLEFPTCGVTKYPTTMMTPTQPGGNRQSDYSRHYHRKTSVATPVSASSRKSLARDKRKLRRKWLQRGSVMLTFLSLAFIVSALFSMIA